MSKVIYECIKDNIYDKITSKEYNYRKTVRCILLNDKLEIGLLVIDRDDDFGKMIHLETPGGGIENNESNIETLKREMIEEVGYTIKNIQELGCISNQYNLINRIDEATYYIAFIDKYVGVNYQQEENQLFKGITWFPLKDYEKVYNSYPPFKVSHIIYERDKKMIALAINILKENNKL